MVTNGYGLAEIRQLYNDELSDYFRETVKILENKGEVEKGSHKKLTAEDKPETSDTAVNQLRQFMSTIKK